MKLTNDHDWRRHGKGILVVASCRSDKHPLTPGSSHRTRDYRHEEMQSTPGEGKCCQGRIFAPTCGDFTRFKTLPCFVRFHHETQACPTQAHTFPLTKKNRDKHKLVFCTIHLPPLDQTVQQIGPLKFAPWNSNHFSCASVATRTQLSLQRSTRRRHHGDA